MATVIPRKPHVRAEGASAQVIGTADLAEILLTWCRQHVGTPSGQPAQREGERSE